MDGNLGAPKAEEMGGAWKAATMRSLALTLPYKCLQQREGMSGRRETEDVYPDDPRER